jgi:GAF domain-containing protein
MEIRVDGRGRYRPFSPGDERWTDSQDDHDDDGPPRRLRRLRALALAETSAAFTSGGSCGQAAFDALARRLAQRVDGGCLIRPRPGAPAAIPVAADHARRYSRGQLQALMDTSPDALGSAYCAWIAQHGRPILTREVTSKALHHWTDPAAWRYLEACHISTLLVVPVQSGSRTVGTLALWREGGCEALDEDDLVFAAEVGRRLVGRKHIVSHR